MSSFVNSPPNNRHLLYATSVLVGAGAFIYNAVNQDAIKQNQPPENDRTNKVSKVAHSIVPATKHPKLHTPPRTNKPIFSQKPPTRTPSLPPTVKKVNTVQRQATQEQRPKKSMHTGQSAINEKV